MLQKHGDVAKLLQGVKFKVLTPTNSKNIVNISRNGLDIYIIQFQHEVN